MKDWKYTPKAKMAEAAPTEESASAEATEVMYTVKTEGFASRNAKTITFVVMLVLFFVFFGPISVFTIYKQLTDIREYEGEVMTEEDLVVLGRLGENIRPAHIIAFERSESSNNGRRTYIVKMEKYILNMVEDEETGEVIVCLLTDRDSGDHIDLRTDDVIEFLGTH